MKRYLVVGIAKTGTTVISKTIQNTLGIADYALEPKRIAFFESLGERQDGDIVVKILFDHWSQRRRLLNAIVHDELRTRFAHNIFITRDPRAEFVSRMHYLAYGYFSAAPRPLRDREDWIAIFRRKEDNPALPLSEMVETMKQRFGHSFVGQNPIATSYADYIMQLRPRVCTLLRYEDFVARKLDEHPLRALFAGSRDVGADLDRTRRSGGEEDWAAFFTEADGSWANDFFARACDALGYDRAIRPPDGPRRIAPEQSSQYVARIIDEAQARVGIAAG